MSSQLSDHFGKITDPRIARSQRHKLIDIITIAVCGVICGADNWVDIEAYGVAKQGWLKGFLELPNGIPSHDTFGEVFARINPEEFQHCFLEWIKAVAVMSEGEVIAIDGKTLCGSRDGVLGKRAIHMISAWASSNSLVLGQVKVDEKSNEMTAIPSLLRVLALSGCIVTLDALGCQTEIATQIVEQGADYVLSLKENQGRLYDDVKHLFEYLLPLRQSPFRLHHARSIDKGHGRIEIRDCWTLTDPNGFPDLRTTADWTGLQTLVMIRRERRIQNRNTQETAFYIASLDAPAERLLNCTRLHWSIENSLHWVLDVSFHEDHSRVRKNFAPQNLAVIRHIALNLLKAERSTKASIHTKRLRAGWDDDYLRQLLSN